MMQQARLEIGKWISRPSNCPDCEYRLSERSAQVLRPALHTKSNANMINEATLPAAASAEHIEL